MDIDIAEVYHFLFDTIPGIGVLVGIGLVISLILCVIFEMRTRKRFRHHGEEDEIDEWELLDDVLEGEAEEEAQIEERKKETREA